MFQKGAIDLLAAATNEDDIAQRDFAFKNTLHLCHAYQEWIGNAEGLDTVMPMYNFLEYSVNYSITSGRLRNFYVDEIDDFNDNTSEDKSFKYKINK